MKIKYTLFLFLFFISSSFGQEVYTFLTELSNNELAPKFQKENGLMVYIGNDEKEQDFFSKYEILDFYQAFPDSKRLRTLNVYCFVTTSQGFGGDLINDFPSLYLGMEDVTEFKAELLNSYPDDYGTTSPVTNMGVPHSLKNFDYINVPKAWDYTFGSTDVKIGISDSNIDTSDVDFKYKTDLLPGYNNIPIYNPPYSLSNDSWHGTGVAAIATAQGDNSHGMAGICSNCRIVATKYLYGTPGTYNAQTPDLNSLLQLAIAGVRVINMSWGSLDTNATYNYYQWIFDEIHKDYNVVLVASSHNTPSYQAQYAPYNYMLYSYPASFNHVISVLSVNHKNKWSEEIADLPDWGEVSRYVEDMIAPSVVTNYQGNGPSAFYGTAHTTNDKVDICAPGWDVFIYPWYALGGYYDSSSQTTLFYGSGTSSSSPHVSGTVGLMYSLNSCLINDEVEDILQLTAKQIENLPGNEAFVGRSGAGKLETGDAVEFVYEMMNNGGNALIDGQDFYRFDFNLSHINNKLSISNQIFRDKCTADFTAKNEIDLFQNVDLKPDSVGYIDLRIDENLDIACSNMSKFANSETKHKEIKKAQNLAKLYPNPNVGHFYIAIDRENLNNIAVEVFDVFGKSIYKGIKHEISFEINLPNLSSGLYIVKLSSLSGDYNETLKFIKK